MLLSSPQKRAYATAGADAESSKKKQVEIATHISIPWLILKQSAFMFSISSTNWKDIGDGGTNHLCTQGPKEDQKS